MKAQKLNNLLDVLNNRQWKDSHNRNCYAVTTSIRDWTEIKSHKPVQTRGRVEQSITTGAMITHTMTGTNWNTLNFPTWERNHLLSMTRSRKRNQTPAFKPNKAASDLAQWAGQHRGKQTTPWTGNGEPHRQRSAWSTAQKGRHNTVRGGRPFHLLRTSPERMCDYERSVCTKKFNQQHCIFRKRQNYRLNAWDQTTF